jgi:rsbT co-antagonist protein RsbR
MGVNSMTKSGLSQILGKHEAELLSDWVREQSSVLSGRGQRPNEADLRKESAEFIGLLRKAVEQDGDNIESRGWNDVKEMLQHLSRSRTVQGYSPSETASSSFL